VRAIWAIGPERTAEQESPFRKALPVKKPDETRLTFLRGVLAAFASNGQVVHYDEVRRMCRFNKEQMGVALGNARRALRKGEPDFCAIVVNDSGEPGVGWWRGSTEWPSELRRVHQYWAKRRRLDNPSFRAVYGGLPSVPGLRR